MVKNDFSLDRDETVEDFFKDTKPLPAPAQHLVFQTPLGNFVFPLDVVKNMIAEAEELRK